MALKLYVLDAKNPVSYDEYDSFVVRAISSRAARKMASAACGKNTNGDIWLDPGLSSCRRLKDSGKPGVIVESFNAG